MAENRVTQEEINALMEASEQAVWEPFPGVTIVALKLPCGFVLEGMSGCVDPTQYDREIGVRIAREHIEDRLWMLEGYVLKQKMAEQ